MYYLVSHILLAYKYIIFGNVFYKTNGLTPRRLF
jgi:hypothetical protein